MPLSSHLQSLLSAISADPFQAGLIWQYAVALSSLAAGWLAFRLTLPHLQISNSAWQFGAESFARVLLPLVALLVTLIARALLKTWHVPHLLNLLIALLEAWVAIRLIVYLLRRAFPPAGWLQVSERAIAALIWTIFALHVLGILPEIADALESIVFPLGKQKISLLTILNGLVVILITLLTTLWLGAFFERSIMAVPGLDSSMLAVVAKFLRALLVLVGMLVALSMAGIDITVLSVFGGALGVGLGFGLQKIASNYVSGFIILLDGSVRLGDMLTADNRYGEVTRMTNRFIVLKATDGTETLIPNETLITSTVINHSFTDRSTLLVLPLQVAYGTDLEALIVQLEQLAAGIPRVLTDPAPGVVVRGFGENGFDLSLSVWIIDPENGQMGLRSEIYRAVWRMFQQHGIQVPYPQREVRVTSTAPPGAAA